jgi:RimJ/RimL family protein N-acetyltransferase
VGDWPPAPGLTTERLSLEPLKLEHAEEMAPLLDYPALHTFTGGRPATLDELRRRYERQVLGHSLDGTQRWLNWIVRLKQSGQLVGTVQATATANATTCVAELAWVIVAAHQGRGYGTEAAVAMARWLRDQHAEVLTANIHPHHEASMRVARALGLIPTEQVIDGEIRWVGTLEPR